MFDPVPRSSGMVPLILFGMFAVAIVALILLFEPPTLPITMHLFAAVGTSCDRWKDIIRTEIPGIRLVACKMIGPMSDGTIASLLNEVQPGEGVAILDPTLTISGTSGEARRGVDRKFLIRINPDRSNSFTWRHEVGGHIRQGHTSLQTPFLMGPLINAVLDLCFVDPYLLFGENWRFWTAVLFGVVFLMLRAIRR